MELSPGTLSQNWAAADTRWDNIDIHFTADNIYIIFKGWILKCKLSCKRSVYIIRKRMEKSPGTLSQNWAATDIRWDNINIHFMDDNVYIIFKGWILNCRSSYKRAVYIIRKRMEKSPGTLSQNWAATDIRWVISASIIGVSAV